MVKLRSPFPEPRRQLQYVVEWHIREVHVRVEGRLCGTGGLLERLRVDGNGERHHAGEPTHCHEFRQDRALVGRSKPVIRFRAGQFVLARAAQANKPPLKRAPASLAEGFEMRLSGPDPSAVRPRGHRQRVSTDHRAAAGSPAGFRRCFRQTRSTCAPQGNPASEQTGVASPACRNRRGWPEAVD